MKLSNREISQYEILTDGMEFEFSALSFDFLRHCENIIFGKENYEIKHFCYYFFNDAYLKGVYEYFTKYIEEIFNQIDKHKFPNLKDNFTNLIIYLKEPKAKENNLEYKNANNEYWRKIVSSSKELSSHSSFRKYLQI